MGCCLTHMHDLIWDFCSSDQRFARELVCSSHPASFRFHLTIDTLAFGYILPTTGRIRDFNPLETCAARRTSRGRQHKMLPPSAIIQRGHWKTYHFYFDFNKKEKIHQSFYDSGGFSVRQNINCLSFSAKVLIFHCFKASDRRKNSSAHNPFPYNW